jgi:deoxyribodipyrimidine photo-lyase
MTIDDRVLWASGDIFSQGQYVLYWMQQSQRVQDNFSLTAAVQLANRLKKPLLVCFGLTDAYPEATYRHYYFMAEGLRDVAKGLSTYGAAFVIVKGSPDEVALSFLENSAAVVMDMGYTRIQRLWRESLKAALQAKNRYGVILESDVVVPVEKASDKEELAARTIRKKILSQVPEDLSRVEPETVVAEFEEGTFRACIKAQNAVLYADRGRGKRDDADSKMGSKIDPDRLLSGLSLDRSVPKSPFYEGGAIAAEMALEEFLENRLKNYELRNHPEFNYMSELSPYLHFGHIGVTHVVDRALKAEADPEARTSFIEELVVRRELAVNFVYYNERYDQFEGMTYPWAYATMAAHAEDDYPIVYDLEAIESGKTHDVYFNSAMAEMRLTGKMHTYMRMYWAKKIIEWVKPHQKAYEMTLYLNNKYFIDGRDPNSYTGVAWCYGKHDHPWKERAIFGKLRYMNDRGLERKFDIKGYVDRVNRMQGSM